MRFPDCSCCRPILAYTVPNVSKIHWIWGTSPCCKVMHVFCLLISGQKDLIQSLEYNLLKGPYTYVFLWVSSWDFKKYVTMYIFLKIVIHHRVFLSRWGIMIHLWAKPEMAIKVMSKTFSPFCHLTNPYRINPRNRFICYLLWIHHSPHTLTWNEYNKLP